MDLKLGHLVASSNENSLQFFHNSVAKTDGRQLENFKIYILFFAATTELVCGGAYRVEIL